MPRRRPMMRGAGLMLGGLVVLLVGGATIAALAFDPNTQKTRITDAVRRATGRDLVISGPLSIAYGLSPVLTAKDVTFANRRGGSAPQMVTVGRVEARIALLPLLTGEVDIASLTLVRPDILLEVDADGVGNWQITRPVGTPDALTAPIAAPSPRSSPNAAPSPSPSPSPSAAPSPSSSRQPPAIRRIVVENGRVTWRDARRALIQVAEVPQATVVATEAATTIVADAEANGAVLHLVATLPPAAQLTGAAAGSSPMRLALQAGDARLSLDGLLDLPLTTASFLGSASVVVPDLQATGALIQMTGLPPLHDVRFNASLTHGAGDSAVDSFTLHLGEADLSRYAAGARLVRLDLADSGSGQPAHMDAEGSLGSAGWRAASDLLRTDNGLALREVNIQSVPVDVQGDLALAFSPRPLVRGTLISHHMDLNALAELRPAPPPAPPATPSATSAAPASMPEPPAATLLSRNPLPWPWLLAADANIQVTVEVMHLANEDFQAVDAHVILHDGALRLDPVSLLAPGGRIDLALTADAAQSPPTASFTLHAPALALGPLVQSAGLPGGTDATVEVDAALRATGLSPHDLAASLSGHLGLAAVDAEVSNAILAEAVGGIARSVGLKLDPVGRSHVRCLAVRLNATAGQVSVAALKLDSSRLALDGTGSVDLAAETVALRLRPTLRLGPAGVLAPVRIDGSLLHPHPALDSPGEAGRTGVVIGGLSTAPDTCGPELAAARDGRAGRMPAADASKDAIKDAIKAGKPADLLRSFLR